MATLIGRNEWLAILFGRRIEYLPNIVGHPLQHEKKKNKKRRFSLISHHKHNLGGDRIVSNCMYWSGYSKRINFITHTFISFDVVSTVWFSGGGTTGYSPVLQYTTINH